MLKCRILRPSEGVKGWTIQFFPGSPIRGVSQFQAVLGTIDLGKPPVVRSSPSIATFVACYDAVNAKWTKR